MTADMEAPLFSCRHRTLQVELHTHVLAEDVVYHLGWSAFIDSTRSQRGLLPLAEKRWLELTKPAALKKFKIPGGKRAKNEASTSK